MALLGALSAAACGGTAIIDPDGAGGGGGATAGTGSGAPDTTITTTTTSSSSSGTFDCTTFGTCCQELCGELLVDLACFENNCFCEEPGAIDSCTLASTRLYQCLIANGPPSVTCDGGAVAIVCGVCDEELERQNEECGVVPCVEP